MCHYLFAAIYISGLPTLLDTILDVMHYKKNSVLCMFLITFVMDMHILSCSLMFWKLATLNIKHVFQQ